MKKQKLSLNHQFSYSTLRTPNGNFTTSFGGAKASGKLASNGKAFKNIDNYVETSVKNGKTYGEAMQDLTDEKLLTSLWPEWNEQQIILLIGDKVSFKKYGEGEVVRVDRKNVFVKFPNQKGLIGFHPYMLQKL